MRNICVFVSNFLCRCLKQTLWKTKFYTHYEGVQNSSESYNGKGS